MITSPMATSKKTGLPLLVVVILIMAFKSNDALTNPQFWAEDSLIFFKDQLGKSLPPIFDHYFGYLHVVPRLIAWCASWASIGKAPLIFNVSALILSAVAISFTANRLRHVMPIGFTLAVFLLVPTNGEIIGTITNAQWFMQFAVAAAAFTDTDRVTGWKGWVRDSFLLVGATSGPFSIFAMIVAAIAILVSWVDRYFHKGLFDGALSRWSVRNDWRGFAMVAIGALVQTVILALHPQNRGDADVRIFGQLVETFTKVVPIHTFGSDFLTGNGWILVYAIVIACLLFGRGLKGDARLTILCFVVFASGELFSAVLKQDLKPFYMFGFGDRYFYALKVVFWWALWTAGHARNQATRRDIATSIAVFFGMVTLSNTDHLRRTTLPDFQWKANARELGKPGPHSVPVNPANWRLDIEGPVGNKVN